MEGEAFLHDVDHGPRRLGRILDLLHRLVRLGVEACAEGGYPADAEAFEGGGQHPFGRPDAFDQGRMGCRPGTCARGRRDGPVQVIGDGQELARQILDGELPGVLDAALAASPNVLGFGERPHQAVLKGAVLGLEGGESRDLPVRGHGVVHAFGH